MTALADFPAAQAGPRAVRESGGPGPGPAAVRSAVPAGDRPGAVRGHARTIRSWPLLVLAVPAAAEVWSGWVGIAQLTGFGVVPLLPGIWSSVHLDTAVTLPVGVECYAAYAMRAWLSGGSAISDRTRRFARGSAICSFLLGIRLRTKKVQARTSDIQRLGKTLESAGIKLGSVASEITGKGPTAMIEALTDGERRGAVMADLAIGRARAKMADLALALEGRFTGHHAMMCRLHLDAIALHDAGIAGLDARIAAGAAPWRRETDLLKTIPGFGDIAAWTWIAEIGPAPHEWFASGGKLASWAGLAPGSYVSAGKRGYGRTSEAGTCIKPALVQAAWSAVRSPGRIQARYHRLVRRMGGEKNPAAKKKAIVAIAHTLLKIACSVLRTGTPYQEPGADFYGRRQQPAYRQSWLEKQLQSLYPGCTVTVTEGPPLPGHVPEAV